MTALIVSILVGAIYLSGWFATSVGMARYFGSQHRGKFRCHSTSYRDKLLCQHFCGQGCWREIGEDPTPSEVMASVSASLAWPVVALVGGVYVVARKPKSRLVSAAEIARMEKEAGL